MSKGINEDYARAERFLYWNKDRFIVNADIQHHWIGAEDRFWYLRTAGENKKEFVVIDATTGARVPAFDHERVAAALSRALRTHIEATALPFKVFRYTAYKTAIQFRLADELWTCQLNTSVCSRESLTKERLSETLSPNGQWAVFVRDHNLWARPTAGGPQFALTTDGIEHYGYAGPPGDNRQKITDIRYPKPTPPEVIWSPDSRYLLTHRVDERKVADMFLVQSVPEDGSVRPRLFTHRYAIPGDENVPEVEPVVFDIGARRKVNIQTAPLMEFLMTPIVARNMWWSADSARIYYLDMDRFSKSISLNAADPVDGQVTEVLRETSKTFLLPANGGLHQNPSTRVLSNGAIIWYSERDGWGHLYYYEATGKLRNQITRGAYVVRGIVRVDEVAGKIHFIAGGREAARDPYYQHLYSINMDGSKLTLLTPEDAEHQISTPETPLQTIDSDTDLVSTEQEKNAFSSSGRYFVYSYCRPDTPPVLTLRSATGQLIKELEVGDISALKKGGYIPVEPFQVVAADGTTLLYGNLFRPSTFDPEKKYPIIDSIYPGPQTNRVRKTFSGATFDVTSPAALAELGFIVVTIDGRGTPHRSKTFLDDLYGSMGKAGNLEDHIAGVRQLGQRYPYMDLDRVGIYGVSGGGYAAAHAILTYPEFYKVAVSAEGNHDQLANYASWGETYNGPVSQGDYQSSANQNFAANLKGKLLLMHGDMDENVPPAQTMKLVDALIKANKDFDLLIIPNGNHLVARSPYFIRRMWDYFVCHLLGTDPPPGYAIHAPRWVMAQLNLQGSVPDHR